MIYTSYFAKLNKLPTDIVPVSICGKSPEWYKGYEYKKLAPKYSFFKVWKETHDNEYYIKHFYDEVLNNLNPMEVLKDLSSFGDKICLFCYEKPEFFCHRHLVADWFNSNNISCKEIDL